MSIINIENESEIINFSVSNQVITDTTLTKPGMPADAKAVGDRLSEKADTDGTYPGMTVGNAEQLLSDVCTEDSEPYKYRASFSGDREFDEIVGGTVAWNQLGTRTVTSQTKDGLTITANADETVTINGTASADGYIGFGNWPRNNVPANHVLLFGGISGGSSTTYYYNLALPYWTSIYNPKLWKSASTSDGSFRFTYKSGTVFNNLKVGVVCHDLTQMFGSTIADYILAQEQATAGAGVAIFRKLFPASYYAYNAGELISVSGLSAHVMRDANNNIIGNYPLDSSLTLRGIPKLSNGKMYFDGDTYASDGTVTRRYGVRAYQSGDTTDGSTMITDGTNTVYKLSTATTETAEPFKNPQIVSEYGTEEYVSATICPVGHNTKYPENLRKKIEGLPWDLSMIAPIENGTTASKAYSVGQYFLHNDVFCKAKTSIASGATFTLNTNYEETTVAAEIYAALHS